MLKNMKVGSRLILGYSVIILVTIVISFLSIFNIINISNRADNTNDTIVMPISYLANFLIPYGNIRSDLKDMCETTTPEKGLEIKNGLAESMAAMEKELNAYFLLMGTSNDDPEEYETLKTAIDALADYKYVIFEKVVPLAMENKNEEAINIRRSELSPPGALLREQIYKLIELNKVQKEADLIETHNVKDLNIIFNIVLIAVAIIFMTIFAILNMRSIVKPIVSMTQAAVSIANGDLAVSVALNTKDEIGELSRNIGIMVDTFNQLISNMNKMAVENEDGDVDARIDAAGFKGSYQEMAIGVNKMVDSYVSLIGEILSCLGGFADGDFNKPIPQFPGKKAKSNIIVEQLRENLKDINNEIYEMVAAVLEGQLSTRTDIKKFNGDWAKISVGLNKLLDAVTEPLSESENALTEMSKGNLTVKVEGNYKGDFALIKNALNSTTKEISSYIAEITDVLQEMANNNLNVEIKREYIGNFISIKNSINLILERLNSFMGEVNNAADQVTSSSRQISESSMLLADGAVKQSNSVDEITAKVDIVAEKTHNNAKNSKSANDLSAISQQNAEQGNNEMQKMLVAMDSIKESSNNISKIIKVIDDIAFQTNLLALNAAVEAARAGTHGKGFAVVAEEVRNLAGRSQNAAKETNHLIEDSINKVNEGTVIAKTTAQALDRIVLNVTEVSKIIEEISTSSSEQSEAISQVASGLSQISQVVQSNSALSERTASAAEQLSSHSETLKNLINLMNLR